MVNLTQLRQVAYLERQKNQALAGIGAADTVVTAIVKRAKDGSVTLDADGVPVILDKRVLKRNHVASEHDARIAEFKASGRIQ